MKLFEPRDEKTCFSHMRTTKVQMPGHPCSLISTFVVHYLDSIITLVSISEVSSLYLASVAEQASLSLTWSETPKTGFLVTWLISKDIVSLQLIQVWHLSIITASLAKVFALSTGKVDEKAGIRNRYNQIPSPTPDTKRERNTNN